MNTLKWKRVYVPAETSDGDRILVDQLWPRGVSREKAALAGWAKGITPSKGIRQAYHQGRLDFDQFSRSYREELQASQAFPEFVDDLNERLKTGNVTLVSRPGALADPFTSPAGGTQRAGVKSAPLPER